MFHNTAVTKQWTAKWPYIGNAGFRIVQNYGEKSYSCRFLGGYRRNHHPLDPPLIETIFKQSFCRRAIE